jgi:hypothetical protein
VEAGTPPGQWLGSGVASLGQGQLAVGDRVSEAQLQLLMGMGRDPITGDPLGHAFPAYKSVPERIEARIADLDPGLSPGAKGEAVARIEAEETERGRRRAVAGFDFTFSIPKSASALWAVADAGTQALIGEAHHAAVAEVVAFMEREVAATRSGATAGDGAVAQVDVTGLVATAFDHFDSRAGDPHLHTHVVISNKVQTAFDGKWRSSGWSADARRRGRAVGAARGGVRRPHDPHLRRRVGSPRHGPGPQPGVGDQHRAGGAGPGVLDPCPAHRRREGPVDRRVRRPARPPALHGHDHQAPRPSHPVHTPGEGGAVAGRPHRRVAHPRDRGARSGRHRMGAHVTDNDKALLLRADDVPLEAIAELGQTVVEVVGEKRSTWRRWNLMAEASRQTMGWRFATMRDREAVVGMIADAAEQASLRLTPPDLVTSPAAFRRVDGTSVFRPKHSTVFSSELLLAAEDRLLDRSRTLTGPTVPLATVEKVTTKPDREGRMLGEDQADALMKIAVSGRCSMCWSARPAPGRPPRCRVAARVGEGTRQGLRGRARAVRGGRAGSRRRPRDRDGEHREVVAEPPRPRHRLRGGVSSSSSTKPPSPAPCRWIGSRTWPNEPGPRCSWSATTPSSSPWTPAARSDSSSVTADDAPELVDVHRFTNAWEKTASLALRHGRTQVIDTYLDHDRIRDGDAEAMTDAAYTAWRADRERGLVSVLVAETREDVSALNQRARADLILDGTLKPGREVELNDGTTAGVGDTIITRRNDRRLRSREDWVRNGDTWTITGVRDDGSSPSARPAAGSAAPSSSRRLCDRPC